MAVGWDITQDHEQYSAAQELQRQNSRLWLVMWTPGSRAYFAFYTGTGSVPPLSAPTGADLQAQIWHVERSIAATTTPAYWKCNVSGCSWSSVNPMAHTPCPFPGP